MAVAHFFCSSCTFVAHTPRISIVDSTSATGAPNGEKEGQPAIMKTASLNWMGMTTRRKSVTGHENVPTGQAAAAVHGALMWEAAHGQKRKHDLKVVGHLHKVLSNEDMARLQVMALSGTMAHKVDPHKKAFGPTESSITRELDRLSDVAI